MGEIKSTLDLVMERTRNLSLNEEEKLQLAINDFRSRLNGILQKCEDELLTADHFMDQLRRLEEKSNLQDHRIVVDEIGKRLNLDQENQWALNLLDRLCGPETASIRAVLKDCKDSMSKNAARFAERIRQALSATGISGNAVEPNLWANKEWAQTQDKIHSQYEPLLKHAVAALNCHPALE